MVLDTPLYRPALDKSPVSDTVGSLRASGIDGLEVTAEHLDEVHARAAWTDGRWQVVFVRAMDSISPSHVGFSPGADMQISCAIWNGSAGDFAGQKSISIWQRLLIDP